MNNDDIEIIDFNEEPSKMEEDIEILDDIEIETIDINDDTNIEVAHNTSGFKIETNEESLNDIIFSPTSDSESKVSNKRVRDKRGNNWFSVISLLVFVSVIALIFIIVKLFNGSLFGTPQNNYEKLRQISLLMKTGTTINSLREIYNVDIENTKNNISVSLNATLGNEAFSKKYDYTLNKSILTIKSIETDDLLGTSIAIELIDAIGQLNGYQKDELKDYLLTVNDYSSFKLANGIEWSSNNSLITIKVNINKKYPMPDNIDYTISDIELDNEFFKEEDYYAYNNSKIKLYKVALEDKVLIYIFEKRALTQNSYQTLLNTIKVLYPDQLDAFKNNYKEIKEGKYQSFNLLLNPDVKDTELESENLTNYLGLKLEISRNES